MNGQVKTQLWSMRRRLTSKAVVVGLHLASRKLSFVIHTTEAYHLGFSSTPVYKDSGRHRNIT
jgi:hypothetical protein